MEPINLGGLPRPRSEGDFQLGMYQEPIEIPEVYKTDLTLVKRQYQNGWPACGAHAGAHFKETQEAQNVSTLQSFSPCFLWNEIKKIDGFPPEMGTDIRSIMKTLQNKGISNYDLLPNNYGLNLAQYTHQALTQDMYIDASKKKIAAYAFNDFPTVKELKQSIYQNKAVIALIWVDDGFFGSQFPTFTQLYKYGHFVVFYGYDQDTFFIIDSTEATENNLLKEMPVTAINFVREAATAIDLPNQYIFKNNLYFGMQNNPEVKELQKRLNMIPENQTGNFGPITRATVIEYQKKNGITPAAGYVGPLTRSKLNTSWC